MEPKSPNDNYTPIPQSIEVIETETVNWTVDDLIIRFDSWLNHTIDHDDDQE